MDNKITNPMNKLDRAEALPRTRSPEAGDGTGDDFSAQLALAEMAGLPGQPQAPVTAQAASEQGTAAPGARGTSGTGLNQGTSIPRGIENTRNAGLVVNIDPSAPQGLPGESKPGKSQGTPTGMAAVNAEAFARFAGLQPAAGTAEVTGRNPFPQANKHMRGEAKAALPLMSATQAGSELGDELAGLDGQTLPPAPRAGAAESSRHLRPGPDGASESAMDELLAQHQGALEASGLSAGGAPASRQPAALSGAEFLSTLETLRPGSGKPARTQAQGLAGTERSEPGAPGGTLGIPAAGILPAQANGRFAAPFAVPGQPGVLDKPALRVIEGGAGATGALGKRRGAGDSPDSAGLSQSDSARLVGAHASVFRESVAPATSGPSQPAVELSAHVTQGGTGRDRLASESLIGISSGIRNLTPQGGGEMRIRLRPENLGELHLRVVTDGSQVGLHIHATDDRARRILEESLGTLKESLAQHQLSLGKVDFTVAGLSASGQSGDLRQDQNSPQRQPQPQASFGNLPGDSGGHGQRGHGEPGSSPGRRGESERAAFAAGAGRAAIGSAARAAGGTRLAASGRLDVRA